MSLLCPHCNYKFRKLAVTASHLPDVAPILCEHCCCVSVFEFPGTVRKATDSEAEAIKQSPAFRNVHKKCGTVTTMGTAIAETYARDPKFYTGTFCCQCRAHFPLSEFVWDGTDQQVGS